jgi:hypothetical protein
VREVGTLTAISKAHDGVGESQLRENEDRAVMGGGAGYARAAKI